MRKSAHIAVAALLCLTSACGGEEAANPTPPVPAASRPAPAATPADSPDAETIIGKLEKADLGLENVKVQDEDTDPNNLLGRPNGYTSRASADLPGGDTGAEKYSVDRGLVVEVFADAAAAEARSEYIQNALKGNAILGTEWHYTAAGDAALIRVTGDVKPSAAEKIEAAVAAL